MVWERVRRIYKGKQWTQSDNAIDPDEDGLLRQDEVWLAPKARLEVGHHMAHMGDAVRGEVREIRLRELDGSMTARPTVRGELYKLNLA